MGTVGRGAVAARALGGARRASAFVPIAPSGAGLRIAAHAGEPAAAPASGEGETGDAPGEREADGGSDGAQAKRREMASRAHVRPSYQ